MTDLFEKTEKLSFVDDVRERSIYPYFHAAQSRQDSAVAFSTGFQTNLGIIAEVPGRYEL